MKPEDLMIGDWFRFRYTIDGKEIVHTFRIKRIEDELGDYYVWGERFGVVGRMCYPERLEPIPLTQEILEKSGWKHDPSVQRAMINTNFQRNNYLAMSWDSKSRILNISARRDCDINIPCEYAHELQHALRLCGIDKEIVL